MKELHVNIYLLCLMLLGLSCKGQHNKKYYLKGQWRTLSSEYFIAKNHPHTIREYFSSSGTEADTLEKLLNKYPSCESYTFDEDGNQVEYNIDLSKDYKHSFKTTYLESGYDVVFTTTYSGHTTTEHVSSFIFLPAGKYKLISHPDSAERTEKFYTYTDNGNTILIEQQIVHGHDTESNTQKAFYDNQRILKRIRTVSDIGNDLAKSEAIFFYNNNDQLDSIVERSGAVVTRTTFKKNEKGDPLEELAIRNNNDTTVFKTYKYEYDAKDNWIKRWEKDHILTATKYFGHPYALVARQITY